MYMRQLSAMLLTHAQDAALQWLCCSQSHETRDYNSRASQNCDSPSYQRGLVRWHCSHWAERKGRAGLSSGLVLGLAQLHQQVQGQGQGQGRGQGQGQGRVA